MKMDKKKKKVLRGVALSCVVVLTLTDLIGRAASATWGTPSAQEAPANMTEGSPGKRDGPETKPEAPLGGQEPSSVLQGDSKEAQVDVPDTPSAKTETPKEEPGIKPAVPPVKDDAAAAGQDTQTAPQGTPENAAQEQKPTGEGQPPDGAGPGNAADKADSPKADAAQGEATADGAVMGTEGKDTAAKDVEAKDTTAAKDASAKDAAEKASAKDAAAAEAPPSDAGISAFASNTFDLQDGPITISDAQVGSLKVEYGSKQSKVVTASSQVIIVNTGTSSTANKLKVTAVKAKVNMTISDLSINSSTTGNPSQASFEIGNGSNVNLTLSGENVIITTVSNPDSGLPGAPAIHVPGGATLTIGGDGTLTATAAVGSGSGSEVYTSGAGIGGASCMFPNYGDDQSKYDSGTIIINSGTINANGSAGAGIGAGANGIAHNVTINGGTVNATCFISSAAIGGGALTVTSLVNRTAEQHITINGGHVTAKSVQGGAGIGGGRYTSGGHVTITGGIVNVPSGKGSNAIGAGFEAVPGGMDIFTTGNGGGSGSGYGNAVILLQKQRGGGGGLISDMSHQPQWGGVIFLSSEGKVYSTPNITESFDIPLGYRLTLGTGDSLTNRNGISINVGGNILNRGTISGNARFHLMSGGRIDNFGTMNNDGDVTIDVGGRVYNGSDTERGTAEVNNLANSSVEVNGDIYNYAKIQNVDEQKITGTGNVFNLCALSVEITKDGKPIDASNPVHYGDDLVVKMRAAPGPYTNYPLWMPEPVKMQYRLWNGTASAPLTATQTTTRNVDGTAVITQTIHIDRTDTIPWEGGKELKVGATMENVPGLQGYIGATANGAVQYDKVPVDMSGTAWTSADLTYDGTQQGVRITGLPALVTATYTGNTATEPGTYKAMPTLAYDQYNYVFKNTPAEVQDSLSGGYPWTIAKGAVTITSNPAATELTDGNKLSQSTLSGGAASVPGTFAWKDPTQVVHWLESKPNPEYDVEFTPTDSAHYQTVVFKVPVKVNPIYVEVTFDPKGGQFTEPTKVSVQQGKRMPKPATDPTHDGAEFAGWYMDEAFTHLWDFDTEEVTGPMTLYAKYTVSDPVLLVAIPSGINIVNQVASQTGVGNGEVTVKTITDPNLHYPNKTLSIRSDTNVVLTGVSQGARIDVQVYDGNDNPYTGVNPLMSFTFDGKPPVQTREDFSLRAPMDYNKPADSYKGTMQFQLELK